jgi:hypothetical protein
MYRLIRFGLLSLEHYNQVDTIGSGSTPTAYRNLPEGGALDEYGDQQKHPGAVERSVIRRLSVPTGSSAQTDLENLFMSLLAKRGTRSRLYRQMVGSNDIHWQYARLAEVSAERSYDTSKYGRIQDISLRFVTQEAFWRGDLGGVWYFDSGEYFDSGLAFDSGQTYALPSSPTAFAVEVGSSSDAGRGPVRAVRMTISAGAVNRSAITIARTGGESITFAGTLLAGNDLVIDTGTMQVLNDGVDAYDDLTLSPTADMAAWFALEPGSNPITVTYTGSGANMSIALSYYEVWY